MRKALITQKAALRERIKIPAQLPADAAEAEMPSYMESFLAHLRLLVGVPFDYLIPDSRLLPDESIRFFYLDRSWTDRLVDGAVAVGKTGTREMAHHQAHSPSVQKQLDQTERGVRSFQRAKVAFTDWRIQANPFKSATVITGFLLRSAAVSGWPHMDVRAYDTILPANFDPHAERARQLPTLRLERLSPSVLIALFEGIPKMVICEEPHHGIQFGTHEQNGVFTVFRRDAKGVAIPNQPPSKDIRIPVRKSNSRVLGIAALRRELIRINTTEDNRVPFPDGAAEIAIELLQRPWRQRFQGAGGKPEQGGGAFIPHIVVAPKITDDELKVILKGYFQP